MKRYIPEPGSNVVIELFERLTDSETLVTSYLTFLEVSSTTARLFKGRAITRSEYQRTLNQFSQDVSNYGFTLIPVQNRLIDRSTGIAREYFLRSLDVLHFVSAMVASEMSSVGQELYMVSADRELITACESYGIPALNPLSNDALDRLRTLR